MTIDPADLAEAKRLAEEAAASLDGEWLEDEGEWLSDAATAFVFHCNPAFVPEVAREVERLRRVEEAARPIIERHAEQIRRLTAGMPDEVAGTYLAEVEAAEAALANPAAAAWLVRRDGSWREWSCRP